ncbi:FAD-dependent oxidoreductase [Caulobacter segnis]|uniref:NAD(P)/FAD-dependent oxidoreductase n=1 Tax=Caulobacter segnis TaxID=88688 RepID=UPI00240FD5BE|nr:FAD-dependent oxidoreductase [Caulobacter segnis]MDG2520427.1 FAD-dependent oxidoreductase [Caulobacter segnis]
MRRSLWGAVGGGPAPRPTLDGRQDAEIAIVGAGIAGLSLACELAAAGRTVCVVEALTPGAGALGASAGIIAPQLVRTTPVKVLEKLGPELGASWLGLVGESGGHLFDLIRALEIDCDARPYGFIAPARGANAPERLQQVVEEWRPFRQDLSVLDADATHAMTGCVGYGAAVLDASGGGVNPLKLAAGLAARAVETGAALFHHSPATALERVGARWRLEAGGGVVEADKIVLCANGGNQFLHPSLDATVLPMRVHELATAPVSHRLRASVLPGGQSLTDLELDIFSIRFAEGERLVTFYPVKQEATAEAIEQAVNRRLAGMLDAYEPVRIEHLWEGVAWINSSLLPRIVALDEGLLAVQACNGRGIATNAIVGREIARMLLSDGRYRPAIAMERPGRIGRVPFMRHVPGLMLRLGRAMRQARGRLLGKDS